MINLKAFVEHPAEYQYSIHSLVLEEKGKMRGTHCYKGPIDEYLYNEGNLCDVSKNKKLQLSINLMRDPDNSVISYFGIKLIDLLKKYEISLRKPAQFEQAVSLKSPSGLVLLSEVADAYFYRNHFSKSLVIAGMCSEDFKLASYGWGMDPSEDDVNRLYWKCACKMNQKETKKRLIDLKLSTEFYGKKELDVINWFEGN